jgi:hypothetical protein
LSAATRAFRALHRTLRCPGPDAGGLGSGRQGGDNIVEARGELQADRGLFNILTEANQPFMP